MSTSPQHPRLGRLRHALLDAPYQLCTEKAVLLTDDLKRRRRQSPLRRAVERVHYRAYRRALVRQSRGERAPRLMAKVNEALMAFHAAAAPSAGEQQIELARGLAHILEHKALRVFDDELIVGNCSAHRVGAPIHPDYGGLLMLGELEGLGHRAVNPIEASADQIRALRDEVFPYWFNRSVLAMTPLFSDDPDLIDTVTEGEAFVLTQFAGISHVTPDYPLVLREGFAGIERRILAARATAAADRRPFYDAALIATRAAIAFAHRWQAHLRAQGLGQLADLFARVPEHPATTLHEALQSVFITHVIVHQESFQHGVSFGRLDQYLLPYFEGGDVGYDQAVELIGCFLVKAAELLPLFFDRATEYFSGLSSASGITLGGVTDDGADAVNALSFAVLDAYDQVRLRQPNIHVRVHRGSCPSFMRRCYEVLKKGGGVPALFNDEAIVGALSAHGAAEADARNYSVVGCAEWGVPGRSFPAAGAGFVSLPRALLAALDDDAAVSSMPTLVQAFRVQLRALLGLATAGNNAVEAAHARYRPTPLLSVLIDGCIEAGRDANDGGAVYNPSGLQGVGLADVADSLAAIDDAVFQKKRCTMSSLRAAVANNFEGQARLHAYLSRKAPKFGEGSELADRYAEVVSQIFVEELSARSNLRGGRYAAGFWTMTTHQGLGRRLGALPSGRLAGEPLANGAAPRTGCERRGPTAAMRSVARVARASNGYVLNQRLDPTLVAGAAGDQIIDGLVRGFFASGGMQVQFSVIDPAVLMAAKRSPTEHRDLVVRISGYSAYFNDLTDAMKDELIARAAHGGPCR